MPLKKLFIIIAVLTACICSVSPARAGEEEEAQRVTKKFLELTNGKKNPYGLLTKESQRSFFDSILNDFLISNNLRESDPQFQKAVAEQISRDLLNPDSQYSLYLANIFNQSWTEAGSFNIPVVETVVSGSKAYTHFADHSYLKLLKEDGHWRVGITETYNMYNQSAMEAEGK